MSTAVLSRDMSERSAIGHGTTAQGVASRGTVDSGRAVAGLRLTRRGRVVFGALLAAPLLVFAIVGGVSGMSAAASNESPSEFEYVTVYSGDTLWSIATELAPTIDPRDAIAEIMQLNGLSDANVAPGQQIAIPLDF